jgi:hypothetical protein
VLFAGIHIDNITGEEIEQVLENVNSLIGRLLQAK